MSKVDILRLDSVTTNDTKATATINTNFANIQAVIEKLLSRDGTVPNYMDAVLDMNSYRIINTAAPVDDFDVINKAYLNAFVGDLQSQVAAAEAAAQAVSEKVSAAAAAATRSATFAQNALESAIDAQQSAFDAAEDARAAAADADRIQGYLEDPNLVAVGEDLTSPDSYIKSVMEAAGDIESRLDDIAAAEGYASDASDSALAASGSASEAKQWAIGNPSEPTGNSAKYWAEQAAISASSIHFNLFHHDWFDYELNNMSWLRADTFSWQDGAVYSDAYQHLVDDVTNGTSQTETISGHTITYTLADDGHKIVSDANASEVEGLYNDTGVAWYYILDLVNHRFKLPRINNEKEKILDEISKVRVKDNNGNATNLTAQWNGSINNVWALTTTVSGDPAYFSNQSETLYSDSSTADKYYAGKKYLYFYVGQFSQTATEQTAGLNAELFNGKADIDLSNAVSNASAIAKETIIGWGMPDYDSGYSVASTTREYCYWVQAQTHGIVLIDDPSNQDWIIRISKTGSVNGTGESTAPESAFPADQITISYHIDSFNGTGMGGAFAYVPKNYYFSLSGNPGNTGKFFPLKGEVNA